jgi:hypothetical protein
MNIIDENLESLKTEIRVCNNKTQLYEWGDKHAPELKNSSELRRVFRDKLDEVRKANYACLDRKYFESLKYKS